MKPNKNYCVSSGSSYVIDLKMTGKQIEMCYHSGDCDEDISRVMELPEIKAQLDAIPDEQLQKWWDEFFCDDTDEEHRDSPRERKLSWLIFDCCTNAIDGYCEEID